MSPVACHDDDDVLRRCDEASLEKGPPFVELTESLQRFFQDIGRDDVRVSFEATAEASSSYGLVVFAGASEEGRWQFKAPILLQYHRYVLSLDHHTAAYG